MGQYVITGAAQRADGRRGIGAAAAAQLREAGHDVWTIDREGADAIADLSTPEERARIVEDLHTRFPDGIDGIATCAAVAGSRGATAQDLVEVNFFATLDLLEGTRDLVAQRQGSSVVVASHTFVLFPKPELVELYLTLDREKIRAGVNDHPSLVVYASGKRALVEWMRTRVADYAAEGVRLNAVVPGYTETPMTSLEGRSEADLEFAADFRSKIPLGQRPGKPEEVAAAITFLLGPTASFVSGSVLLVDGGHDVNLRPGPVEY
ncbi:MAG: SDR family oxidoreductase [Myxococcota bacterium]